MMRPHLIAALLAALCLAACTAPTGPRRAIPAPAPKVEAAFSPDGGAEQLVVRTLASAQRSIHLAAYTLTSPAVVGALVDAQKRGVVVLVLIDERGSRSAASQTAIRLMLDAGITVRATSVYAIHDDKYAVIDGETVQTGSFNYSQTAARAHSENVLVVRDNIVLSAQYDRHWLTRWAGGFPAIPSR